MSIEKFIPNSLGNTLRLLLVVMLGIGIVTVPWLLRQPLRQVAAQQGGPGDGLVGGDDPAEADPELPEDPGQMTPEVVEQSAEDAVVNDPPLYNASTSIEIDRSPPSAGRAFSTMSGGSWIGAGSGTWSNAGSYGGGGEGDWRIGSCLTCNRGGSWPGGGGADGGGNLGGGESCVKPAIPDTEVQPELYSTVSNLTYNYMHWGWDVLPPSSTSTAFIQRIHRTRDIDRSGSFGAGCFLQADIRLELAYEHDPGIDGEVVLFDPNQFYTIRFDADFTATGPSAYDVALVPDSDYSWRNRSIEMLDGTMAAVTGSSTNGTDFVFTGAEYARITDKDGNEMLFELLLAGVTPPGYNPTTDHPPHGRLVSFKGIHGRSYDVTYKTWTPAEITASPERQWQIDTITDTLGQTINIDYYSTQQNGDWVIETITQPGGQDVDYTYGGGFISQIDYPDSSQTTVTYAAGANGSVEMDLVDVAAEPKHRRKTVVFTGSVATVGGTVVPTSVGMIRYLTDGAGEVRYFNGSDDGDSTTNPGEGVIYKGGGRLSSSFSNSGNELKAAYYGLDWEEGTNGVTGAPSFTGTNETKTSIIYGLGSGGSTQPSGFEDSRGIREDYEYDSDQRMTFKEFQDGTFEAYSHNSLDLVTRMRDRNGNVTKHTYDADGRKLSTSVGLTDGPSNPPSATTAAYNRNPTDDVQTSDYATLSWTYVASGNDGAGKVSKYTDELGNETDYSYDTSDRLNKITGPVENVGGTRPETTFTYDAQGRLSKVTDPLSHETEFFYDSRNRLISTLYDDGTTAKTTYGTSGNGIGLPVKTIDRNGVVNTYAYDAADRLTSHVVAAAQMDGMTETATPDLASTTTYTYIDGTNDIESMNTDGRLTEYAYDHRGRRVGTFTTTSSGTTPPRLRQASYYDANQLYVSYDQYDRITFYGYDADGRLERTVQGLTEEYDLPSETTVADVTRDLTANADRLVTDYEYDAVGNLTSMTDPRGNETTTTYDSRNRATVRTVAVGTTAEAKTETDYD
ncbi:MAG: hypothetical protein AAF802_23090, partial [Planctomycetota bacterium]